MSQDSNRPLLVPAAACFERGKAHLHAGEFQDALAELTKFIKLYPAACEARLLRAISHATLNDCESAIADFTAAIRLDPECANAYAWRGSVFLRLNQTDEALADLDDSIQRQPDVSNTYVLRATAHKRQWNNDAAIADVDRAIELAADSAAAFLLRGQLRSDSGEFELAVADLSEAIRLDELSAQAYLNRARAKSELEQMESAIADYTRAIELGTDERAEALWERSKLRDELGDHAQAEVDFETANKIQSQADESMPEQAQQVLTLLRDHFQPAPLSELTITERSFPCRVRADLQQSLDRFVDQMRIQHFSGVRVQYSHTGTDFTELLVRCRHEPPLSVPPQYEELDIGEPQPMRCLTSGLWLLADGDDRFAIFQEPKDAHRERPELRFQIATLNDQRGEQIAQKFFQHLERAVREARTYRGKIISLEYGDRYSGKSTGIKVHKLRQVHKDQVILPPATLKLLERNVLEFVRKRARLAELGLATKKGLLFYGPPGTGKTHTIHYLASALSDTTTLLISAEQVGHLGEYMTLARLLQPSLVIIEDADLIARERSNMQSTCEEVLLNKLLNEMDGLRENADILFVLTTNRPEALEAALASRPGRIDQAIEFPFPDETGRKKLIQLYSRGAALSENVVEETARRTKDVSGAFIKELMRRSLQFQLERDETGATSLTDVDAAMEELLISGGSLNQTLLGAKVDNPGRFHTA